METIYSNVPDFFQDAAMVLEEQPSKVSEAVKLFLQGLGYTTVRSTKLRSTSLANTPIKKIQKQQQLQPQTAELLIEGLQELVLQHNN